MYCRPFAVVPALAVTSLASAGFAEPSERECKDAAAAFAEMLNPKEVTTSSGIGWVLLPPAVDFYSLDAVEQWRAVAERFVNLGPMFRWKLVKDGKWSDEIQPEHRSAYAAAFLMDDTLEQCLRPLVVASSKELQSEIAKFDSEFPSDERETLRPLMKASQ